MPVCLFNPDISESGKIALYVNVRGKIKMNNQITYFEDYDHLINKGGRKSFFLNYFFFNMIDALSFNKNVIDMLDHSAKCDSYIQAKKQETYNFLSSRQDIDKIISLKEDDPQLNSYLNIV